MRQTFPVTVQTKRMSQGNRIIRAAQTLNRDLTKKKVQVMWKGPVNKNFGGKTGILRKSRESIQILGGEVILCPVISPLLPRG